MTRGIQSVHACDVTAVLISERAKLVFFQGKKCVGGMLRVSVSTKTMTFKTDDLRITGVKLQHNNLHITKSKIVHSKDFMLFSTHSYNHLLWYTYEKI